MSNPRQKWIEKYFKLRFSSDSTQNQIREASDLKKGVLSQLGSLYRYRGTSDINNLITSLNSNKNPEIRLNEPFNFNDPFDTRVLPAYKIIPDYREHQINKLPERICKNQNIDLEFKEKIHKEGIETLKIEEWMEWTLALAKIYKKYNPNYQDSEEKLVEGLRQECASVDQKICKEYQEHMGISCFSEGGNNLLMWSHYSDGHKGICLAYDVSSFANLSPIDDIVHEALFPVRYQDQSQDLIDLTRKFFTQMYNPSVKLTPQEKECLTWKIILTKACCWSYEQEWRLVYQFAHPPQESDRLISMKPSHIYLGAKIAENHEAALRKCAEKHGIPINKMQISDDGFELIIGK